jgi:hypothetical protein
LLFLFFYGIIYVGDVKRDTKYGETNNKQFAGN